MDTNKKVKKYNALRARRATFDDIKGMLELDRLIFSNSDCWLSNANLSKWLYKYPDGVTVLKDKNGLIYGRSTCLPLENNVQKLLRRGGQMLDHAFVTKHLLSKKTAEKNALQGGTGNICFVSMLAVDPVTEKEKYDHAIPLFLNLLTSFYSLKMRTIVAKTHTELADTILLFAGAEKIRDIKQNDDAYTKIWYFDGETAMKHIASGLSVVYFTCWAIHTSEGLLKLTQREREIIDAMMNLDKTTNKDLAESFCVSQNTIKTHFKNIFRKCKDTGMFKNSRPTRANLVNYCKLHPEEWVLEAPSLATPLG